MSTKEPVIIMNCKFAVFYNAFTIRPIICAPSGMEPQNIFKVHFSRRPFKFRPVVRCFLHKFSGPMLICNGQKWAGKPCNNGQNRAAVSRVSIWSRLPHPAQCWRSPDLAQNWTWPSTYPFRPSVFDSSHVHRPFIIWMRFLVASLIGCLTLVQKRI